MGSFPLAGLKKLLGEGATGPRECMSGEMEKVLILSGSCFRRLKLSKLGTLQRGNHVVNKAVV